MILGSIILYRYFCRYCYANYSEEVISNFMRHNVNSSLLIGDLEKDDIMKVIKSKNVRVIILNKKRIIIVSIIMFVILIVALIIYFNTRIVVDNSAFTLNEDLTINVYNKVKVSDFIKEIDGKIVDDNEIDTTELGVIDIEFIYLNSDNKKRKGTFSIEVKDLEEPLIWLANSYSVRVGEDVDLESEILCADNYDSNPSCKITGDYDLNTAGSYSLVYEAEDSSGNKERVDFTLYVYEPKEVTGGGSSSDVVYTDFNAILEKYKSDDVSVGIDVSKWQGAIDFSKVKNSGAEFVIIRVGSQNGVEGEYILDPYFKRNIKEALENDLEVGIYFYSYANNKKEAEKQAQWVIEQIEDYDITLPIAFDFESFSLFNSMNLSLYQLNEVAKSYFSILEAAGYNTMLYGSKNYLNAIWKYNTNQVWLAHYTDETDYDKEYMMWQLCQDGVIDGINGYVDIDILYK